MCVCLYLYVCALCVWVCLCACVSCWIYANNKHFGVSITCLPRLGPRTSAGCLLGFVFELQFGRLRRRHVACGMRQLACGMWHAVRPCALCVWHAAGNVAGNFNCLFDLKFFRLISCDSLHCLASTLLAVALLCRAATQLNMKSNFHCLLWHVGHSWHAATYLLLPSLSASKAKRPICMPSSSSGSGSTSGSCNILWHSLWFVQPTNFAFIETVTRRGCAVNCPSLTSLFSLHSSTSPEGKVQHFVAIYLL